MITDETSPEDFKPKKEADHSHIKGWGIDADPENDPTYPIKERHTQDSESYPWERPPQQPANEEVLHSVERPGLTATFGTSVPPSGLSGKIRRNAFKFSESSYGHWLPLILADRIAAVEGIVDDIRHGFFPNVFAERGLHSEWKYNRKSVLKKLFAGLVITTVVAACIISSNNKKHKRLSAGNAERR